MPHYAVCGTWTPAASAASCYGLLRYQSTLPPIFGQHFLSQIIEAEIAVGICYFHSYYKEMLT